MNLPQVSEPVPDLSVIKDSAARDNVDKALVDKALVRAIAKDLPTLYDRAVDIALTAEHDSDSVAMLKTLFDRAAGKASQDVNFHGSLGVYQLPPEEVAKRIESLRLKRDASGA